MLESCKYDFIPKQFTVKTQEHDCVSHVTVLSRDCVQIAGHHGFRHLASVTRCKTAKAVVKPFIVHLATLVLLNLASARHTPPGRPSALQINDPDDMAWLAIQERLGARA